MHWNGVNLIVFLVFSLERRRGFRGTIPWHGNWDDGESVPFQTGGVFFCYVFTDCFCFDWQV
jgi:hypothetical protein